MDFAALKEIYSKIDGFLADPEAQLLYSLAFNKTEEGEIVEIGSWKGKSTAILAIASRDAGKNCKVYAIDPHTGSPEHGKVWTFPDFERNVAQAGIAERVVPMVKTSEEAVVGWTQPVGLLWIDGHHGYEFVKKDFDLWQPFVINGGTIAFHDARWSPGVYRFVRESVFPSNFLCEIKFVADILYAKKVASISLSQKLGNLFSLALWLVYRFYAQHQLRSPVWLKKIMSPIIGSRLFSSKK